MRELIHAQELHQAEHAVAEERGPSYSLVRDETLPPMDDLIREHRAMVLERQQQQREANTSFATTMFRWAQRERKGRICP